MYQTAGRVGGAFPTAGSNRVEHCTEDLGPVAVPDALTFRMPDGARFTIEKLDASSTLKDLAKTLHEAGGVATRAFPVIELGRSFNFSFGGRAYPADSVLSSIHQEMDLNTCGDVACKTTEARFAADKLKSSTGLEWRVLNETVVLLESPGYRHWAEVESFVGNALEKIPHVAHLIEVRYPVTNGGGNGAYYCATLRLSGRPSIRALMEEVPLEIQRSATIFAQAIRNADTAALGAVPLDILARLGMYLAPELDNIDSFSKTRAEIEHAGIEYQGAPVFRKIEPCKMGGIHYSVMATVDSLLRSEPSNWPSDGKLKHVSDARLSNSGLSIDFSDADYAGKFIRAMKHADYNAASLERRQSNGKDGECKARIWITDFNEIKQFMEATCGFAGKSTKALFDAAASKPQLPADFFVKELEAIGRSGDSMTLEQKKAAAKGLVKEYLPYLDRAQAGQLKEAIQESARPDANEKPGPLQYLREKRGAGRFFSFDNYSDDVATFREILAAIDASREG